MEIKTFSININIIIIYEPVLICKKKRLVIPYQLKTPSPICKLFHYFVWFDFPGLIHWKRNRFVRKNLHYLFWIAVYNNWKYTFHVKRKSLNLTPYTSVWYQYHKKTDQKLVWTHALIRGPEFLQLSIKGAKQSLAVDIPQLQ